MYLEKFKGKHVVYAVETGTGDGTLIEGFTWDDAFNPEIEVRTWARLVLTGYCPVEDFAYETGNVIVSSMVEPVLLGVRFADNEYTSRLIYDALRKSHPKNPALNSNDRHRFLSGTRAVQDYIKEYLDDTEQFLGYGQWRFSDVVKSEFFGSESQSEVRPKGFYCGEYEDGITKRYGSVESFWNSQFDKYGYFPVNPMNHLT